jgi:hypothetical protein
MIESVLKRAHGDPGVQGRDVKRRQHALLRSEGSIEWNPIEYRSTTI